MKGIKDLVMKEKSSVTKRRNVFYTDPIMQQTMIRQYLPKTLIDVGLDGMHCTKFKREELNFPKLIKQKEDFEYEMSNGERKDQGIRDGLMPN